MTPLRFVWFAWAAVGIVLLVSLTRPAARLPGHDPWVRGFDTPEISREAELAQTFIMSRDGLDAIEFRPEANGQSPSGDIRLTLVDLTAPANAHVVRAATVRATELANTFWYRFEFMPIANSRDRSYRFEMTASETRSGLVLRAAKGDGYRDGTLMFNGRSRWADLAFRASAPTLPLWKALWTQGESGFRHGKLILTLLIASWLGTAVLLRAVGSLGDPSTPSMWAVR